MAGDVHEQVFSEEQLFTSDVRGEEEEEDGGEKSAAAPSASHTATASSSKSSSTSAAAKASSATPSLATVTTAVVGGVRERRRKRAAERATKIVYWLESKYDVLPEICSSFENWKEAPSATYDFDLLWCDQSIPAERFMKLKPYQKMNHFVGMSSITRKNNLGRNLLRMRKQYPKEYKFFPDTWILPTDLSDFKQQFSASKNKTFIIKPDNGCQGKGIYLIRDVEKVPVDFSTTYVAQRYIHRPFLLDGFKFDLRLYVLVVGCDPLRIFLHRRGLVRLASEQYVEPAGKNLSQAMVHLTNYAINKMNPNFEENTNPDDAQDGHKRSWEAVQEHLRKEGHDVDTLLEEIEDLIIKTLIAVQPSLSHFYHSCQPDDVENSMCFEILGFDVIMDKQLQPWLLEVNHAPSFATESDLDRVVKEEVLRDTFALLDLSPEGRRQKKREVRERMEQRAMGVCKKHCIEERVAQEREGALLRTEWEDAQLVRDNGYKRLYPSCEQESQYCQVHDAAIQIWEMLMGGSSRRSVRLSDPAEKPPDAKEADGKARAGSAKIGAEKDGAGDAPKVEVVKRTAEEIREVVDRLMQGCSARPRKQAGRRRGSSNAPTKEEAAEVEDGDDGAAAGAGGGAAAGSGGGRNASLRPEVQVGDVIKVQTNLGWETVTVRAKRSGTGKIDIQFKDGEYMRSVLPRILRDANGQPASGDASAPEGSPAASERGGSQASPTQQPAQQPAQQPQQQPQQQQAASRRNSSQHPTPNNQSSYNSTATATAHNAYSVYNNCSASSASSRSNGPCGGHSPTAAASAAAPGSSGSRAPAAARGSSLPPALPVALPTGSEAARAVCRGLSPGGASVEASPTSYPGASGSLDVEAKADRPMPIFSGASQLLPPSARSGDACSGEDASAVGEGSARSNGSGSGVSGSNAVGGGYAHASSPGGGSPLGGADVSTVIPLISGSRILSNNVRGSMSVPPQQPPVGPSGGRNPEVRLRQQLQHLMSVRPIVVPRGRSVGVRQGQPQGFPGVILGIGQRPEVSQASGLSDLEAQNAKQVARRRTLGER